MIKLAYNKEKDNLAFMIDKVERDSVSGFRETEVDSEPVITETTIGIIEKYVGTLVDTTTNDRTENYKVPVKGFESNWTEVPVGICNLINDVHNQSKSATPTTSAQEITPDSSYTGLDKVTVAAVTSAIDANITAGNIKSGVTILGVSGSVVELAGETVEVTPTTAEQTITPGEGKNGITSISVNAVTSAIDANIIAENIKKDVTILGVTGTYEA